MHAAVEQPDRLAQLVAHRRPAPGRGRDRHRATRCRPARRSGSRSSAGILRAIGRGPYPAGERVGFRAVASQRRPESDAAPARAARAGLRGHRRADGHQRRGGARPGQGGARASSRRRPLASPAHAAPSSSERAGSPPGTPPTRTPEPPERRPAAPPPSALPGRSERSLLREAASRGRLRRRTAAPRSCPAALGLLVRSPRWRSSSTRQRLGGVELLPKPRKSSTTGGENAKPDPGGPQRRSTAATPAAWPSSAASKRNVLCRSTAEGLEPPPNGESYTVWLYRSPKLAAAGRRESSAKAGGIAAQFKIPAEAARLRRQRRLRPDRRLADPNRRLPAPPWPRRKRKRRSPHLQRHRVLRGRNHRPGDHAGQQLVQPGSSLPGFMIPAGSSRSLTARSTSIPVSPDLRLHVGGVVAADRVVVGDRRRRRRRSPRRPPS